MIDPGDAIVEWFRTLSNQERKECLKQMSDYVAMGEEERNKTFEELKKQHLEEK